MARYAIDFKELKELARFEPILAHYRISHRVRGDQASALCPFHNDRNPSLRIHLGKRIWQCMGCKAKGNVLEFVQKMERSTLPQAAAKLADICGIGSGHPAGAAGTPADGRNAPEAPEPPSPPPPAASAAVPAESAEAANPPLRFSLKLDPEHPYLDARHVGREERTTFGIGYCERGLLKGRIAIPIHDEQGQLVAYAGRWPGDDWPADSAKYLLPPNFAKQRILFNLHRVTSQRHLVLVEGFFSVFRLHRLGVPAGALMGSALSEEHVAMLARAGVSLVTVMMDGDEPGNEAAARILHSLARHGFFVRQAHLPDGSQPDTVDETLLLELVGLPDILRASV